MRSHRESLGAAVFKITRHLARILLRHGISFPVFAELAKRAYIDIAKSEFRIGERKQSVSRISILTGLSRKEVARVMQLDPRDATSLDESYNRAARVINGWIREARYQDKQGKPLALPLEGKSVSFNRLAREYGADVPVRAILDELEHVGAIKQDEDGLVHLRVSAYVPCTSDEAMIGILGNDVSELIGTIDHNMNSEPQDAFFQRKVSYDNIPEEALASLRSLSADRAQALLELLNQSLSQNDRDAGGDSGGTGRKKVSVGIYYHEADASEDDKK